jgi:hypothetical protein
LPIFGANGEHVVGVDVNLGHVIALDAISHCDRVKAEHSRQDIRGLLVTARDVHPNNGVPTFEQPRELLDLMSLETSVADKPDIHKLTALPRHEAAHPRPECCACRHHRPSRPSQIHSTARIGPPAPALTTF